MGLDLVLSEDGGRRESQRARLKDSALVVAHPLKHCVRSLGLGMCLEQRLEHLDKVGHVPHLVRVRAIRVSRRVKVLSLIHI